MKKVPHTLRELKDSGYHVKTVKEEMRDNLIVMMKNGSTLFPGIIGYDETVIPQIQNAILSHHDFIFLGLRGQAKSKLLRGLTAFLDEEIPVIQGCEINDNPFSPCCKRCYDLFQDKGDEIPIEWIGRNVRYTEKLATPDVTIADLIGDIDPIKAAVQKLHYAHEGSIHFGIIPRMNRGIFAINEIPDLQQRIQVGLLNIMQEKDIQIRGFPVRIPLDILIVYTANPEDYTNRGNIITPLRDRIASQIHTHYPASVEDGIAITQQESWTDRNNGIPITIPRYFKEIIEYIAVQGRESEYIDQKSGVSARLPISCMENLISNIERRNIYLGENEPNPRICDLDAIVPSIVGKIELVYEGEQEGSINVARLLVGQAVKEVFTLYFPQVYVKKSDASESNKAFEDIKQWFAHGNVLEISDLIATDEYYSVLDSVTNLKKTTLQYMKMSNSHSKAEIAAAMEFVLESLHQHSVLSKNITDNNRIYADYVDNVFSSLSDNAGDSDSNY
ncbi:magnesium chelatase [candidate division KSB1 bacterium]|nr:magnesium chelatase [candidate division KSB1 bacterium]